MNVNSTKSFAQKTESLRFCACPSNFLAVVMCQSFQSIRFPSDKLFGLFSFKMFSIQFIFAVDKVLTNLFKGPFVSRTHNLKQSTPCEASSPTEQLWRLLPSEVDLLLQGREPSINIQPAACCSSPNKTLGLV